MGVAGVTIKTMPESPSVNLEEIKEAINALILAEEGKILEHKEEPIAFGLKAIISSFKWNEQKDADMIMDRVQKIPNVSSCQVIDVRRMVQ